MTAIAEGPARTQRATVGQARTGQAAAEQAAAKQAAETVTMAGALNRALADALADDETVLVFGEDVGALGGVFRVTDGLARRFGETRVFDTPLAESGIVGTAIGMAMNGLRPVVEMQFDAFAYPAFEQIVSHLAKLRNRTRGRVALPVVIRIPYGGGVGGVEHHSDSSEAYYAHTAGLRVVTPGTPGDAYTLLRLAIESPGSGCFPGAEAPLLGPGGDGPGPRGAGPGPRCCPAAGLGRDVDRLRRDEPAPRWKRPKRPGRRATASRSSTCAACPPSTMTRSPPRSGGPAGPSWCTRRAGSAATAPRWPRGCPNSASTTSKPRSGGWRDSISRTRRRTWRTITCPAWTASSTRSTACSGRKPAATRKRAVRCPCSCCPTWARG